GFGDRVYVHDAVPGEVLLRYIASADVGVIPIETHVANYYYSLPNKLFELMMAGRPVAAADLPEIRRIVSDEQIGAIFDQTDPADIARAVVEVLDSPDYATMCGRARGASSSHCWEREAERLVAIYDELASHLPEQAPVVREEPKLEIEPAVPLELELTV